MKTQKKNFLARCLKTTLNYIKALVLDLEEKAKKSTMSATVDLIYNEV